MNADRTTLAHLRHELRTPLNHIIGYGEMLLEDLADDARGFSPHLRRILEDARQVLAFVSELRSTASGPDELVGQWHLPQTLVAPLDRIVAGIGALKELAHQPDAAEILPDLERMVVAAEYLLGLATHGTPPPSANFEPTPKSLHTRVSEHAFEGSPHSGAILVVDDDEATREMLARRLAREGYSNVVTAADGEAALDLLQSRRFDLVLLDVIMPGVDGFAVCERIRAHETTRDIPVIFLTAVDDTFDKVRAFSAGAVDYVTKPFQPQELFARVDTHLSFLQARRALEEKNARLSEEIEAHRRSKATIACLVDDMQAAHRFVDIVGESRALQRVLGELELVAATDSTVLIQGETGTGKELVARAIHRGSARRERPLITVNCATLPRDLVESELFGHEKGAFTGATAQRRGRFELADGGTLFLDEIAELPPDVQAKLLRVLQEHEFERVGGTHTLSTDVRVIAATNRDLQQLVARGAFRSDLYYRLNVFPLALPPLRERREDIPRLIRHFMARAARKLGKRFDNLAPGVLDYAMTYDWPGNVRELENFVERAAILSRGVMLEAPGAFIPQLVRGAAPSASAASLEEVERAHIVHVLEQTRWVIEGEQGAARLLGLNASTLRGRMRKLGIRKAS